MITINSIERVKAALNFEGPDKVPMWHALSVEGDVFTMFRMPSKHWQPGYYDDEKGLFPHPGDDSILKAKLWTWDKPEWAELPEFDKWINIIPRENRRVGRNLETVWSGYKGTSRSTYSTRL